MQRSTIWKAPTGLRHLPAANPTGRATLHPQPLPNSLPNYTPLLDEAHLTCFVGHIPPHIDDEYVIKILQACGPCKCWKRATDPYGEAKNFGFAVYADTWGLLNALRFISGDEKYDGNGQALWIPGSGDSPGSRLVFTIDQTAKNHVAIIKKTSRGDEEKFAETREKLDALIRSLSVKDADAFLESLGGEAKPKAPLLIGDSTGNAGPVEQEKPTSATVLEASSVKLDEHVEFREVINKEIEFFRVQSAKHELERQRQQEQERRRLQKLQKEEEERLASKIKSQDGEKNQMEELNYDSEEEAKKAERRKREAHEAFLEREKRFMASEETRFKRLATDERRQAELAEKREKERVYWSNKLRDYDDDRERESGRELFYTDRARWLRQRKAFRAREDAADARDRDAVTEAANRRSSAQRTPEKTPEHEEEEPEIKVDENVERILTMQEREEAIKKLAATIPTTLKGIFAYKIRWDYINEKVLGSLKNFVLKKIVEFVGDQHGAERLSEYILDMVRQQMTGEGILQELKDALDVDEAELLVLKLFRMIIYETEARLQNLS